MVTGETRHQGKCFCTSMDDLMPRLALTPFLFQFGLNNQKVRRDVKLVKW